MAAAEEDETPEKIAYEVDNGPHSLTVTKSAKSFGDTSSAASCGFTKEPSAVAETRSMGNVSIGVYLSYFSGGGSVCTILFVLFTCLVTQLLCTGEDYWISYW